MNVVTGTVKLLEVAGITKAVTVGAMVSGSVTVVVAKIGEDTFPAASLA